MLGYLRKVFGYKDLIVNLTSNELKLKYKNSILGFLWSFIYPIMMLIIYNIAFKEILKIKIENFVVFVFIGLLPWNFVQAAISQSTNSIINNQSLVKKVYFPRIIIPLSVVSAGFINMLISLVILFLALVLFKIQLTMVALYLPLLLLMTYLLVCGMSFFLSSITVKFRDISYIVDVIFIAWFYLTPVIYSVDMVPGKFKTYILANPLTELIELYREVLLYHKVPTSAELSLALLYSLVIFCAGVWFFYWREEKLGEEL